MTFNASALLTLKLIKIQKQEKIIREKIVRKKKQEQEQNKNKTKQKTRKHDIKFYVSAITFYFDYLPV